MGSVTVTVHVFHNHGSLSEKKTPTRRAEYKFPR